MERAGSVDAFGGRDVALACRAFVDVVAFRGVVEFLVLATPEDAVADQLVALEALDARLVVVEVRPGEVRDETVLDFGEDRAFRPWN